MDEIPQRIDDTLGQPQRENEEGLCPKLWTAQRLKLDVRTILLDIVNSFIRGASIDLEVLDIILSGDLATVFFDFDSDLVLYVAVKPAEYFPEAWSFEDKLLEEFEHFEDREQHSIGEHSISLIPCQVESLPKYGYDIKESRWLKEPNTSLEQADIMERVRQIEADINAVLTHPNTVTAARLKVKLARIKRAAERDKENLTLDQLVLDALEGRGALLKLNQAMAKLQEPLNFTQASND